MKESRSYSYKEFRNDMELNSVSENILIPAFDIAVEAWLEDLKKRYSTYADVTTDTLYVSVDDFIVRITFKKDNMDYMDHEESIMMTTHVFMYADDKTPLETLMNNFGQFLEPCTEERLKKRVRMQMKKKNVKTYHMSKKIREYYNLV